MTTAAVAAATGPRDAGRIRLPGELSRTRLGNGLRVVHLRRPGSPLVAVALWYGAGTRDEARRESGAAHFLEHMMFKGSDRFGVGEVDRLTQRLGGSNNAFTSHDATVYHFTVGREHWRVPLEIEADRMAGLSLLPDQVDLEREVILEELAMYESEPWDRLEREVLERFFEGHPYGRPVLGTRAVLGGLDAARLRQFHSRWYRPDNAVLVVVGDLEPAAVFEQAERFPSKRAAPRRRAVTEPDPVRDRVRVSGGDLARLLWARPAPPSGTPEHAALRVLLQALFGGRASRVHRELVEEQDLALWVLGECTEAQGPNTLTMALEARPGTEPERVEDHLRGVLRAGGGSLTSDEIERGRRMLMVDWIFGHERVAAQASSLGAAELLFEPGHGERALRRALAVSDEEVRSAWRWLEPGDCGVVGWSSPTSGGASSGEAAR